MVERCKSIPQSGNYTITIQGTGIVITINIIEKLGVQTKRLEVLVYCDFHFGIPYDKEDVMFATNLDLFSIGTIMIPTHTKPIPKLVSI
jgi:hypothetical protein